VKAGLDTAYNPYSSMLDATRLGIAGHSYGAAGVSYIGQWDPRVKAIVAWDNLAAPNPNQSTGASGGGPAEQGCVNKANRTVAPVTKPALGLSADYFIPPQPNRSDPDPLAKSTESRAVLEVRRRQRRADHPRRHPLRLRLGPEPGLPGDASRCGHDRLVHDRLVRQVREGRLHRRPAPADGSLAP